MKLYRITNKYTYHINKKGCLQNLRQLFLQKIILLQNARKVYELPTPLLELTLNYALTGMSKYNNYLFMVCYSFCTQNMFRPLS